MNLEMKKWHIQNLFEACEDCQVVQYIEAKEVVDKLDQENAALKAMVNTLKNRLENFLPSNFNYFERFEHYGDDAERDYNKTPSQCLNDVKADAAKVAWMDGFESSREGVNGEFCPAIYFNRVKDDCDKYAEKIRRGE